MTIAVYLCWGEYYATSMTTALPTIWKGTPTGNVKQFVKKYIIPTYRCTVIVNTYASLCKIEYNLQMKACLVIMVILILVLAIVLIGGLTCSVSIA